MVLNEEENILIEAKLTQITKNALYTTIIVFPLFLLIGTFVLYVLKWETIMLVILSVVAFLMFLNMLYGVFIYFRLKDANKTPQLIVTNQRIFVYNKKNANYDALLYNDITFWDFSLKKPINSKRWVSTNTTPATAEFVFMSNGQIYKIKDIINYQNIHDTLVGIIADKRKNSK